MDLAELDRDGGAFRRTQPQAAIRIQPFQSPDLLRPAFQTNLHLLTAKCQASFPSLQK